MDGIDERSRELIKSRILGKMKENGIGIIFIHYNSEKIQKFCDRILIMRHGFLADEVETAETSEQDLFRRLSAERGRKSAERKFIPVPP